MLLLRVSIPFPGLWQLFHKIAASWFDDVEFAVDFTAAVMACDAELRVHPCITRDSVWVGHGVGWLKLLPALAHAVLWFVVGA